LGLAWTGPAKPAQTKLGEAERSLGWRPPTPLRGYGETDVA
jgi:hypothetical protein